MCLCNCVSYVFGMLTERGWIKERRQSTNEYNSVGSRLRHMRKVYLFMFINSSNTHQIFPKLSDFSLARISWTAYWFERQNKFHNHAIAMSSKVRFTVDPVIPQLYLEYHLFKLDNVAGPLVTIETCKCAYKSQKIHSILKSKKQIYEQQQQHADI